MCTRALRVSFSTRARVHTGHQRVILDECTQGTRAHRARPTIQTPWIPCYIYTWTPHVKYQVSTTKVSLKYQLSLGITAFICTSTSKTLFRKHSTSDTHGNRVHDLQQQHDSEFTDSLTSLQSLLTCDRSCICPWTTFSNCQQNHNAICTACQYCVQ